MPAKCLSCGAVFLEAVGPCAQCGGPVGVSDSLTGVDAKCIAGQVGTVADSPTSFGGQRIRYAAPTGSRSDASLVCNLLTVQVKPPIDVGLHGEPRVLACVVAYLAKTGKESATLPASNQKGEDGVLQISGDRVTVQVVTATPCTPFWGRVAKGSGEVQAELTEAIEWIHIAIAEKAKLYPKENKSSMLLSVDVVHMGVLAGIVLGTQYLKTHGDPSARFGFGAVWLIGPSENHVLSLGSSRW
jgi:hypothetical protein